MHFGLDKYGDKYIHGCRLHQLLAEEYGHNYSYNMKWRYEWKPFSLSTIYVIREYENARIFNFLHLFQMCHLFMICTKKIKNN